MLIKKAAVAGTLESSDAYVRVEPNDILDIQIESVVYHQFAETIEASVKDVLKSFEVTCGSVFVNDRGAVDCVLRARVETAVLRSQGE